MKKSKVLNIISNVCFVIVMILLVTFMIYGFGNLAKNKVPSFFGQSYVRILSNSMNDPVYKNGELISNGFEKGDVAVIKKVNVSEIEEGDIIAYYYCSLVQSDFNGSDNVLDFKTGENSYNTQIYFHQVIDIQVDSEGYVWFQTKGTSNTAADKYTRSDYVVGVYTDSGLASFLEFISSSVGIVVIVVVPSCIVLFMLLLSIIDTIDKMMKKKKEEQEMEAAIMQSINNNQEINNGATQTSKDIGLSESTQAEFEKQLKKIEKESDGPKSNVESKTVASNINQPASTQNAIKQPPKKPVIVKPNTTTSATSTDKKVETTSAGEKTKTAENKTTETKVEPKTTEKTDNKQALKTDAGKTNTGNVGKTAENKQSDAKVDNKVESKAESKPQSTSSTAKKTETKATATSKPSAVKDSAKTTSAEESTKTAKTSTSTTSKSSAKSANAKSTSTTKSKTSTTGSTKKTDKK